MSLQSGKLLGSEDEFLAHTRFSFDGSPIDGSPTVQLQSIKDCDRLQSASLVATRVSQFL